MPGIKSLAKDTAVYGLSSIIGRFLNWCLVPLYAYLFVAGEYGVVSYLYAYTAVALVILNYGMETGFFRFANKGDDSDRVYTTTLISTALTSGIFIILLTLFLHPVAKAMLVGDHPEYVWLLGVTVAADAFCNIPFAWLRFKGKAWHFAGLKLMNVALNIGLNLFFLLMCPWLIKVAPASVSWFYREGIGIGWIFIANFISTFVVLLSLLPTFTGRRYRFSSGLLKQMLRYSWPLLILGVAGIMSQNMGQLLIPYLFDGEEAQAREMVGIFGANIKIAIVMVMFTQAFRYAYEPFIFAQARSEGEDNRKAYADAMKYFVIFGLLIFLGVMYFLPILRHFIAPGYWSGLMVVPVMMLAELFFGIYFNLSLWYKLTDKTQWGMYFSLTCFVLMLVLNVWLVPLIGYPYGYMGSAWAALISYFVVMVLSWAIGRRKYPIPYQTGRMLMYFAVAILFWGAGDIVAWFFTGWWMYVLRTLLLIVYISLASSLENIPVLSPMIRRIMHR